MNPQTPTRHLSTEEVERWLHRLYVVDGEAGLRREDRRKAVEVGAILREIERIVARAGRRSPLILVDAAAGKSYVGLLAAKLILEPWLALRRQSRTFQETTGNGQRQGGADGKDDSAGLTRTVAEVILIEREADRVCRSREAAARLESRVPIDCRAADVADPAAWPAEPFLVVALHACGPAADIILQRAVESRTLNLMLVPCCTGRQVDAVQRAVQYAERLGVPRQAPVRRRFVQALVDMERTWRLEAAGYETEVIEFVSPLTTPHNLLWRARRVGEVVRRKRAAASLERWLSDNWQP